MFDPASVSQTPPPFSVSYDVARETIHAAKRAGSPVKAEVVTQENFVLSLGFLQGLAGQYGRQQESAIQLQDAMGGLVQKFLGETED